MQSNNSAPRSIWLLAIALAFVGAGQSTMFILIPPEVRNLGFNEFQVGLIFSISAVAWMISSPFWGDLSDKFGRHWIFLIGMIGFAISLILITTLIESARQLIIPLYLVLPLLILTRLINGLFGSAVRPAAGGRIADITTPELRTAGFARFDAGWQFGVIVGPIFVGLVLWLSDGDFSLPFLIIGLAGLIAGYMNFRLMKNSHVDTEVDKTVKKINYLDERIWPSMFVAAFMGMSNATMVLTASLYFQDLSPEIENIYPYVAFGFSLIAISGLLTQLFLVDRLRLSPYLLLRAGPLIMLVSFLGIAFAPSIYVLFVYLTLHGVGSALTRSGNVAQLSLSVNKNEQGLINGLLGGVMPLGHLLTPIITMPLYMIAPNYPFIFIAILSVLIIMFINLSKKFTNKLHTGDINV